MTLMATPEERELNRRLIEISKAISELVCAAATDEEAARIRDEALRTITEQSEAARQRISRSATSK